MPWANATPQYGVPMKSLNFAVVAVFLLVPLALTGCEILGVFDRHDADGNEAWRCSGRTSEVDRIVLTRHLLSGRDTGTGTVQVAGVTHWTTFHVAGVQRRWNWDHDGSRLQVQFYN